MSAGTKVAIAVTVLFVLVLGVYYGFTGPIGHSAGGVEAAAEAEAPGAEAPGQAGPQLFPPQQAAVQPAQGILGAAVDQSAGEPFDGEPPRVLASDPVWPAPQEPAVARPVEAALGFGPVAPAPSPAREQSMPGPEYVEYTVQEDESLWTIAAEQLGDGSRWSLIAEANPSIKPDRLRVGQKIRLPGTPGRIGVNRPAEIARGPAAVAPSSYVVRSGDTLSTIAKRLYRDGERWHEIYDANRALIGADPDRLDVGMTLRIP